ncbi:MAG: nitrogen regulation protein NR(II) [SAR86 cluster bacterium]|uniref:histidine kinase n=1 Tax=SAR86 cluster bacterium TaxID=2030880 RepID=A0A2A5AXC4_9GAMM|nr:MAG: nitrogen regulation protein NR(II) [SAR86 cluster bacterium]
MSTDNVHKRLLDNLKTGVVLLDSKLCLLYLNIAAESLLDISDRKANKLFIGELFTDAVEDINEMHAALTNNRSFTKRKAQLRLMHGKNISVDYTLTPFEENGEQRALLELDSLEHSHRFDREESLNSTHATTRELVRGLAHEIKNPLGGIRGAAQLLARELDSDELKDYTNVIIEEADRLHNLVDRLVGSRKLPNMQATNVHEVLERVRSLVAAEISGNGIQLIRDYDPSIPSILADSEQLIQAMLNIVRNAMQSLSSPAVDHTLGEIYLRTRIIRNATIGSKFYRLAASIMVIDNGPGIPEEMIDSIFYPMISGRAEGTGLGLSITHAIINQHKGMIEVESHPGSTCFSVILPIADSG